MDIDVKFLRDSVNARRDVGKWLNERPNRGLDVTDVATLCAGYDYLVEIIKDITGEDISGPEQLGHDSMQVTFLDLDQ